MQKKFIEFLVVMWAGSAMACDICGNNPNAMYVGLLPNYSSHFVGIKYRWSSYESIHSDRNEFGKDILNEFSIWGRYSLSRKIQFYAQLPYQVFHRTDNHQNYTLSGMGDMTLSTNYTWIDNSDSLNEKVYHLLQTGVGIKLPTGKSDVILNGNTIIPTMQMGSGSVDFLTTANYLMRIKKWGWNTDISYKWNTKGSQDYTFGNALQVNSKLFYWYQLPKMALIPYAGIGIERFNSHKKNNITDTLTGGFSILPATGVMTFWNRMSIHLSLQIPTFQNINQNMTQGSIRVLGQINYFITPKK